MSEFMSWKEFQIGVVETMGLPTNFGMLGPEGLSCEVLIQDAACEAAMGICGEAEEYLMAGSKDELIEFGDFMFYLAIFTFINEMEIILDGVEGKTWDDHRWCPIGWRVSHQRRELKENFELKILMNACRLAEFNKKKFIDADWYPDAMSQEQKVKAKFSVYDIITLPNYSRREFDEILKMNIEKRKTIRGRNIESD